MNDRRPIPLRLPDTVFDMHSLHVGDIVLLSGELLTARDVAHKWLVDAFVNHTVEATDADRALFSKIKSVIHRGAIYHCGPVVTKLEDGSYKFVAAGPTTSMREEPYEEAVIDLFGLSAVIGKGGMGASTLAACERVGTVYLSATGGAGAITAACVKEVIGVFKLEWGIPEAMWWIRVEELPLVVSMDAHGNSLHETMRTRSKKILDRLILE